MIYRFPEFHDRFWWKNLDQGPIQITSQCLQITEKVSMNIASEASSFDILNGQKLIKNAKNGQFDEFLKT